MRGQLSNRRDIREVALGAPWFSVATNDNDFPLAFTERNNVKRAPQRVFPHARGKRSLSTRQAGIEMRAAKRAHLARGLPPVNDLGEVVARYIYSDGDGARQNGIDQLATRLGANQDTSLPFSGSNVPEAIELLNASGAVTQTLMLSTNQVGSVQLVTDAATGEVVQRLKYDELGRVLSDSAPGMQPFGFAGGLYDVETHLVRFGARDYSADVGRWIARDAVREKGGSNSFTYLFDDPINGNDPLGFASDVSWFFSLWNFAKELLGIKSGMDCNEAQRDLDRARKRCDDQNAACWGPSSSMEACQEKCEETGMNPTSPSSDRMKCLMKTPEWKKWGNSCGPSVLDFL